MGNKPAKSTYSANDDCDATYRIEIKKRSIGREKSFYVMEMDNRLDTKDTIEAKLKKMFDTYEIYSLDNDGDFIYNVYFRKECVGMMDVFVDEPMGTKAFPGKPTEKKPLNVVEICLNFLDKQNIKINFESAIFEVKQRKIDGDESATLEFLRKLKKIGITFNESVIK